MTQLPDPQVTLLFATPLAIASLAGQATLLGQLGQGIRARCAAEERLRPPRRGEAWRSSDSAAWGGDAARALEDQLTSAADQLTIDVAAAGGSRYRWSVALTAQVGRAGEAAVAKHSPDAFWGAMCFIDDGYVGSRDPALGGEVAIEDPRLPATMMEAPDLRLRLQLAPREIVYSEEVLFRPAADRLLLYPGWMRIGHRPFHGAGERIWIAADLVARRR